MKKLGKIIIKNVEEIQQLKESAKIVSEILGKLEKSIKPKMNTLQLDKIAYDLITSMACNPAFLGYRNYPASICVSLNNELVHGIPSKEKIINEGDIVSIDLGIKYNSFYGDIAKTIPVGKISTEKQKLLEVTYNCLEIANAQCYKGNRVGDISYHIQSYVESRGYSVIRDFVGHAIGRDLHEKPDIPNFGNKDSGPKLLSGMVLCLEPMVSSGSAKLKILNDGWTAVTVDNSDCAHFEHMVVITDTEPEVITYY